LCFEAGRLAQTQSSAKVNKRDWFYPAIYVVIVSAL